MPHLSDCPACLLRFRQYICPNCNFRSAIRVFSRRRVRSVAANLLSSPAGSHTWRSLSVVGRSVTLRDAGCSLGVFDTFQHNGDRVQGLIIRDEGQLEVRSGGGRVSHVFG